MLEEIEKSINELNDSFDVFKKSNDQRMKKIEQEIEQKNNEKFNYNLPLAICKKNDEQDTRFALYIKSGEDLCTKSENSLSTDGDGGIFIPEIVTQNLIDKMKNISPMRSIAKIMTISSNSVDILLNTKLPEAGWINEINSRETTDISNFKKLKIPVCEIYAKPKATQKLLDDCKIDIEAWIINKISEKFAKLENHAFINGDGIEKPVGFLSYCKDKKIQCIKSGACGSFAENNAVDALIDLYCSLKSEYLHNAKWIMSRSALAEVKKLQDKSGKYIWHTSDSINSKSSTLFGYEVVIDDDMPPLVAGKESFSIAFGDFYQGYQVIDRDGIRVLRDPYSAKPFVEFYVTKRTGGDVIDCDAIKIMHFAQ